MFPSKDCVLQFFKELKKSVSFKITTCFCLVSEHGAGNRTQEKSNNSCTVDFRKY